jgi:GDPmannose 4,6-dehydratase
LSRRALITGITGQVGPYLAEHLLAEGYDVFGLVRGHGNSRLPALGRELPDLRLVSGEMLDQSSLVEALNRVQPDEVYNLASASFVPLSWQQPEATTGVTGLGVLRLLEAIRIVSGVHRQVSAAGGQMRFYQASSSEMFGNAEETPQNERTPLHPRSPYGVAKCYGHLITQTYRESYGMHAVSGILFNHESPRRGVEFVTRKITLAAARIAHGLASELRLGNLEASRDWGFAGDHVRAMHGMVQCDVPRDYVVGTGETHTVREFVEIAFHVVGLDWRDYVIVDQAFVRPAEVDLLRADPKRVREELGWEPEVSFEELVTMMVEADMRRVRDGEHGV